MQPAQIGVQLDGSAVIAARIGTAAQAILELPQRIARGVAVNDEIDETRQVRIVGPKVAHSCPVSVIACRCSGEALAECDAVNDRRRRPTPNFFRHLSDRAATFVAATYEIAVGRTEVFQALAQRIVVRFARPVDFGGFIRQQLNGFGAEADATSADSLQVAQNLELRDLPRPGQEVGARLVLVEFPPNDQPVRATNPPRRYSRGRIAR